MTVTPQQLAETLKARTTARQEALRRRGELLRREVATWAEEFVGAGRARHVWLIGSLATGRWGERSDVDVVVEGLPAGASGVLWAALAERLDAAVDLLELEDLPPAFAQSVKATGVQLA